MRKKHILSTHLIFEIAHELRKLGKTVGLTHGAFDLFHYSHLDLLEKSSELCDFLIVGVDSDESISKYKSYKRPIIHQDARLAIINQLNCVDAVFIKEAEFLPSDMMQELYKEINPNIITIGQNFACEDRLRSDASKVKVKFKKLDVVQNYSTTKIIEQIIQRYSPQE